MKKMTNILYSLNATALLYAFSAGSAHAIGQALVTNNVPEPSMLALLGVGAISALLIARRRK